VGSSAQRCLSNAPLGLSHLASCPDEDVVRKVADEVVGPLLLGGQAAGNEGDVLQVPGVSIGQGRAVANARDLVAVIPPCKSGTEQRGGGPDHVAVMIEPSAATWR
jgi:hypothetical protein